jgi:iron complex outermembrane recepter protein
MVKVGMKKGAAFFSSCAAMALVSPAIAQPSSVAQSSETTPSNTREIEEVIVTATKRPEAVRGISGSISAKSGAQLERLGADGFADYLTRTPGVVLNAGIPGNSSIVIRGVAASTQRDLGQSTTGIFINDVPLTDPTSSIGSPDIDAFDVDNVTVLRGPQGTLFGSASLGGAVNYQASKPDLNDWLVHVQTTLRSTEHGGVGGAAKLMFNAPLAADKFAVRGVLVYREDAGFIDNVQTAKKDTNSTQTLGGRILATWQAGNNTEVNYLFLQQSQDTADLGYEQIFLSGRLQKQSTFPETGSYTTLIHNLRLDQKLSFATLTATATYHEKTQDLLNDFTQDLSADLFDLAPIPSTIGAKSSGETYEVRLASNAGGSFDFVVGAMYDETNVRSRQTVTASGLEGFIDEIFGAGSGAAITPGDLVVDASQPAIAREAAIFGEGTYYFNDQFKGTFGGRLFDQKITNGTIASGLIPFLNTGETESSQFGTQKSSGFNPKVSLTWTPSDDMMVYSLASKGFRFGGGNAIPALPGSPAPLQYESDSLWNYEIGMRSDWFEERLQIDATVFYIDWNNIQLPLKFGPVNYTDNAGSARIYGLEATAMYRVAKGLNFTSNVTYLDAKLSESFDPLPADPDNDFVLKGTRLPGASEWQVSNSLSYLGTEGKVRPSFLLSHRYTSKALTELLSPSSQGGYHLFDARLGANFEEYSLTVFVDNVGDVRGVTSSGASPQRQYLVRPRTFGITFSVKR